MTSATAKRVTVKAVEHDQHRIHPCSRPLGDGFHSTCYFYRRGMCGRVLPVGIDPELVRAVNMVENETGKSCINGSPYIWIKE